MGLDMSKLNNRLGTLLISCIYAIAFLIVHPSIEAQDGNIIKGTEAFSDYKNNNWSGDLDVNGIRPEKAYKLQISQIDTLVLKGDILDPNSRTINLKTGWNWIGFMLTTHR